MSISGLLNQTITIAAGGNKDRVGKESFGSATTVSARFQRVSKTRQSAQKTIEPIDGIVFVEATVTVNIGDKLVHDSKTYRVMGIDEPVDMYQVHHKELLVQEWSL